MPDVAPLQFLLAFFAGIVSRHQQRILDFVLEENSALRKAVGDKRVKLDDDQRIRLATLGKALGRELLENFATIVTPDTILGWHRRLVAMKWTYSKKSPSRPRMMAEIARLVVQFARENPLWGYKTIQGVLENISHQVARSTIAKILERNGIQPAPNRRTPWSTFLRAHLDGLAGADFLSVEVWTLRGLRTFFILFAIRIKTRKVEVLGITDTPNPAFAQQAARNLIQPDSDPMIGITHLIIDRDGKFTPDFRAIVKHGGVTVKLIPPRSPNCNPHAKRFVRTLREGILDRMIFFGEESLRRAVTGFVDHYHLRRNHQGLDNRIITPGPEVGRTAGKIERLDRLSGMLRYYFRAA